MELEQKLVEARNHNLKDIIAAGITTDWLVHSFHVDPTDRNSFIIFQREHEATILPKDILDKKPGAVNVRRK